MMFARQKPKEQILSNQSVELSSRTFDSYSLAEQEEAMRRKAYIDAIEAQPSDCPHVLSEIAIRVANAIGDPNPPSKSSLYRWRKNIRNHNGDMRALIPKFTTRGRRGLQLTEEQLEILSSVVQRIYLTLKRKTMREVHDNLRVEIAKFNANNPENKQSLLGYDTVRRFIRTLSKYDVTLARYGREYARKKFRNSGITPSTFFLLERVEIDHTPLNVFVIDEETFLVLGRPYITWAIDCHTRMIIGFYVSFSAPNIQTVFECIKHAVTQKNYIKKLYPDIKNDWPAYGVPLMAVVDNGLEFRSEDLKRATFELRINYKFCPPRTPWYKPMVERSFRTLADHFCHVLPGTTFSNWFERYGYDSQKQAVITLPELIHALHIWIVDIYSQSFHRGLLKTPYSAWKEATESTEPRDFPPERLNMILTEQETRTLGHAGVEINSLRYNSPDMHQLRKQLGDRIEVNVRYNNEDLGMIHVIHPMTKEPISVPCLNFEYANGLRLYQHKLIRKSLKEKGLSSTDPLQLAQAKVHMQEVVGQLLRSQKLSDRKKAAKSKGANSSQVISQKDNQTPNASKVDCEPPIDENLAPNTLGVVTLSQEAKNE